MRGICQFCKKRVAVKRADEGWEFLVPAIDYHGFSYHVACYDKLRAVARATGGVL